MIQQILFDDAAFRNLFPEFQDEGAYPPATLQLYWDTATSYVSDVDDGCFMLTGPARVLGLNQMTAHMAKLFALIGAGETPLVAVRGRIDKVEVEAQPPPTRSMFQWWLAATPYGQQLAALLTVATAGGIYVGTGYPERAAFRKAGGAF